MINIKTKNHCPFCSRKISKRPNGKYYPHNYSQQSILINKRTGMLYGCGVFESSVDKNRLEITKNLRPAKYSEYKRWLKGYTETHIKRDGRYGFSDYKIRSQFGGVWADIFTAIRDFNVLPCFGAHSIQIIVPEGVKVLNIKEIVDDCGLPQYLQCFNDKGGHNTLYFLKDFSVIGGRTLYAKNLKKALPFLKRAELLESLEKENENNK